MTINTTIVLIGLNPEVVQVLAAYLGSKYRLNLIDRDFNIDTLKTFHEHNHIVLFLFDIDQPFISIQDSVQLIKSHPIYQNIPVIGMAMKQHYHKCKFEDRKQFDDIILMPPNYEDLLTRIEVWIRTYNHLENRTIQADN